MNSHKRVLPTLDLKRNYALIKEEVDQAIHNVLDSQYFVMGPEVAAFEKEMASYMGVKNAVSCASGSDALYLAFMALGLKPGDEVITTPFTFFASTSCITRLGGIPVFVDIDPLSYNIDVDKVLEKVTPRTKAFMPVHLFGQMVPMDDLFAELERRKIAIVEDSAQSTGSWRKVGDKIIYSGSWGDVGCFSFFPTKNLGAYGDGGMIVSDDEALAERLRRLHLHGAGKDYIHEEVGLNSRLDALQAAVLRVKLRHLDKWNEGRRKVAQNYDALFAHYGLLNFVTPPKETEGNYHTYHQYVIRATKRDELMAFLTNEGIATRIYYPLSLHLQNCFDYLGGKEGDFPVTEKLTRECLALPIFPELTEDEQVWVVEAISRFYK